MIFFKKNSLIAAFLILIVTACKKNFNNLEFVQKEITPPKILNLKEKETVAKFEHASLVLQGLFSANPEIRKEFNGFIAAKLAKSGTDEELTFKEIFEANPLDLQGVKSDFLYRFREAYAGTFVSGKYPNSSKYKNIKLQTVEDVAKYYEINDVTLSSVSSYNKNANSNNNKTSFYEAGVPYEIYFPYSENWDTRNNLNYTVTYHPLTTIEWNYGMSYNSLGNPLKDVTVNDDYAYANPTYIVTYDDGLKLEDFSNGLSPIEAQNYSVGVTSDDYNPIVMENIVNSNQSPCTKELRVKDGRWTFLRNGYGLFEGKIEFAVAISRNVSEVTIPSQTTQSNPLIQTNREAHAFGYKKITRNKVKKMRDNTTEYVDFGLNVSPWCDGQPDKMLFIYEYDKPNTFSKNAAQWANLFSAGVGLIGDPTKKAAVTSFVNSGIAPLVKNLLEGTADSKIEHYSIIGSNAVWLNQRVASNGANPSLLNGYRPYGINDAMVTLVID